MKENAGKVKHLSSMTRKELKVAFSKSYSISEENNLTFQQRLDESTLQFRFDVVGGNPRHFNELGETLGGSTKYVIPIQQAIKSFFGPEYVDIIDGEAPKHALGTWSINT